MAISRLWIFVQSWTPINRPPPIKRPVIKSLNYCQWNTVNKTPIKDVRANCFCASLLRTQIHAWESMPSNTWTMIRQMAIAITLPGFKDLGRSVTPIFLLMDHFLYRFSTFSEKMKKIYWPEVWVFCKMHHRIPFFLALRLSARRFQMPLEGLSFNRPPLLSGHCHLLVVLMRVFLLSIKWPPKI